MRAVGRIGAGLAGVLVALVVAAAIVGAVVATDANLIRSGGWWYLLLILAWPVGLFAWVHHDKG